MADKALLTISFNKSKEKKNAITMFLNKPAQNVTSKHLYDVVKKKCHKGKQAAKFILYLRNFKGRKKAFIELLPTNDETVIEAEKGHFKCVYIGDEIDSSFSFTSSEEESPPRKKALTRNPIRYQKGSLSRVIDKLKNAQPLEEESPPRKKALTCNPIRNQKGSLSKVIDKLKNTEPYWS